jgi:signal transduction histidine kinase
MACNFLIFVASYHPASAADSRPPNNILILCSFSDRSLFDRLDGLKSAIRSRVNWPVNSVHYMEAQGFEDPGYEKSLSQNLSREYSAIVLFRQPTRWERNQKYILTGVAVIVLQALLIVALVWQRVRKRSAVGALEKMGGLLIHAQEEERASIARELHDDFSQRLALQCIELTQLEHNLPKSQVEERTIALKMLAETKEMSADMRSLSHQLHSSRLELVGLVSALRGLCEEITKNYKITVHFTGPEFPPNLTKDMELCLFRVAQEALANVVKHSQASSAHVELGSNANGVSLCIADAGKGFDSDQNTVGAGIGLMSMRERLRLFGGGLAVRSGLMRGTEVLAQLPLSASANKRRA